MSAVIAVLANAVYAIAILVAAYLLAGFAKKRITALSEKTDKIDPLLAGFFASMAKYAILAISVIFVLGRFGIETTSLVAIIGAAGLAIGLALQGTLSNLAAGVMLVAFRPIKVGDVVEVAGQTGKTTAVTLFTTELTTPDNVQIIIPNNDVWSSSIVNYSAHDTRRVDLVFGVGYGSDLKQAETIITDMIKAQDAILADQDVFVKVTNLGDSSVDFTVRVWCKAVDYWDVKFALTRDVKEAFDAGGIDIPYPTTTMIQG